MPHEHHCDCCHGHDHGHDHEHNHEHACCAGAHAQPIDLTESHKAFLHHLSHHHYLPVARFTLEDSRQSDFVATALAPVFLQAADDDMETVKAIGAFLQEMEDMGLITLDYDIPLDGYGYEMQKNSALYAYFCETVAEGAAQPGFVGNTPVLDLGSIALTETGAQMAAELCHHEHHHHE